MKHLYNDLVRMSPELKHDPFVRSMLNRENRLNETDKMHCMNSFPMKSGWILLLQNRVSLSSVGNLRYSTKVYYDCRTRRVGTDKDNCVTPFQLAKLKNNQSSAGWTECN